jgi:hypothetical protein
MKNRLYLVCGVLLVAALGGLLWWSPWVPREPVYDGHPLAFWLTNSSSMADKLVIADSNAVPFLIKALTRDSWVGAAYYRKWLWPQMPPSIQRSLPPPPDNWVARCHAAALLNSQHEKRAIPAFIRALKEDDNPQVRLLAARYLGELANTNDKSVVVALTAALNDTHKAVRYRATVALSALGQLSYASSLVRFRRDGREFGSIRWSEEMTLLGGMRAAAEAAGDAGAAKGDHLLFGASRVRLIHADGGSEVHDFAQESRKGQFKNPELAPGDIIDFGIRSPWSSK